MTLGPRLSLLLTLVAARYLSLTHTHIYSSLLVLVPPPLSPYLFRPLFSLVLSLSLLC